ncbi:MAG: Ni-sirohydrochlorin a,c-diamide reductive cyclase catalytic subunit [archaeon]|nr:Ni-sirohydrochlorin a,c-diamide reductive cyclase catalytic subunit [archaeon]
MSPIIHPRPNPIVAAMYTLRDMDVDVIVTHGPAGCCFMASRPLENAGVRIVTSALKDNDLIFGGGDSLVRTLKEAYKNFHPRTMAVVGTCASTIIGDDIAAAIKRAELGPDCNCFAVDCSGCMADNTQGAIRAIKAGVKAGLVSQEECDRQVVLLKAATDLEKKRGMAAKTYLCPAVSPTKMHVCKVITNALKEGKKVAVIMLAKKELAYRFADMFVAVDEARKKLGGQTLFVANMDESLGLSRIRRYCSTINAELDADGVKIDCTVGGLAE